MKKITFLVSLLIGAGLLAPTVLAAPPVQGATGETYIVQADDWLSKIADKFYSDVLAYPTIVAATNAKAAEDDSFAVIDNPDVIEIGQKLWIPAAAAPGQTAEAGPTLSLNILREAEYQGIYEKPIQLTEGVYEGEPFDPGGTSRPMVTLIDSAVAYGDLNGDGATDAAALLIENSGGSGSFSYLAAVINEAGKPVNVGTTLIGDRIQLKSMMIENGQIVVEMITQGPNDPFCCATLKLRVTFGLEGDQVVVVNSEELGSVSNADLTGTSWQLARLTFEQAVAPGSEEVSLTFAEGQVSGSGGCNSYSAAMTDGGGQALTFGPVIATLKACPEPTLSQETEYFAKLQNVNQWSYLAGQLALSYTYEGEYGVLVFNPVD